MNISSETKQFILDNYYTLTSIQLAEMFNIKQSYVSSLWYKSGLRGKQKRIYSIDEHCFENIETEEQAYALGFLASDGCIYKASVKHDKQNIIRFCIHKDDIDILNQINSKVFKSDKPILIQKSKYCVLEHSSDVIFDDLNKLGISTRKTYGNTYVQLPDNLMRHFIRGYFDGDGSISYKCGKDNRLCDVSISISGYKSNILKFINYLNTKNIFASFCEDKRKYNGDDVFGSLILTNKTLKYAFLRFLYDDSTIYLDRKKKLANNFINIINQEKNISDKVIKTYYNNAVLKVS